MKKKIQLSNSDLIRNSKEIYTFLEKNELGMLVGGDGVNPPYAKTYSDTTYVRGVVPYIDAPYIKK
ncbi:MAG: hypothetical protein PHF99_11915 [Bacteroidales bacterium]|nr:hypothetical protein [Bacteroidales bacterium]